MRHDSYYDFIYIPKIPVVSKSYQKTYVFLQRLCPLGELPLLLERALKRIDSNHMTDPWDDCVPIIYLHEWLILMVNVGEYIPFMDHGKKTVNDLFVWNNTATISMPCLKFDC